MDNQIEEMIAVLRPCRNVPLEECRAKVHCKHCTAEQLYNAGYRKQEDLIAKMEEEVDGWKRHYESLYETAKATIRTEVARAILEELKPEIMPIVDEHNELAEKTGDAEWGFRADGMEIALLALKKIIKKFGVTEE